MDYIWVHVQRIVSYTAKIKMQFVCVCVQGFGYTNVSISPL